jgi:hypothetical protein
MIGTFGGTDGEMLFFSKKFLVFTMRFSVFSMYMYICALPDARSKIFTSQLSSGKPGYWAYYETTLCACFIMRMLKKSIYHKISKDCPSIIKVQGFQ